MRYNPKLSFKLQYSIHDSAKFVKAFRQFDIKNSVTEITEPCMRRKGFEPPTYWFVASHSIQLSYRRIIRLATMIL